MSRGLDIMTGLGRPLTSTSFSVNITVPVILRPFVDDVKEINYRCLKASMPGFTLETVEVPGGDKMSNTITYPTGRVKFDKEWTTEFLEGNLNQVKKFLLAWLRATGGDFRTGLGSPVPLKTTGTVKHYDGDTCVDAVTLIGLQPTKLNASDLELKDSADAVRRQITWSIDAWESAPTK